MTHTTHTEQPRRGIGAGDLLNAERSTTDMTLLQMVHAEVNRARRQHPRPFASEHEAMGILLEEYAEFFDEVCEQDPDPERMVRELLQIAAVAIRAASEVAVPQLDEMDLVRMQVESCGENRPERRCRYCGCTEDRACVGDDGLGCHWIGQDLCSACEFRDPETLWGLIDEAVRDLHTVANRLHEDRESDPELRRLVLNTLVSLARALARR